MPPSPSPRPVVFLLGLSADIGLALAERFLRDGYDVVGTARDAARVGGLAGRTGVTVLSCDVAEPASVRAAAEAFGRLGRPWDAFVSCVGALDPIGPFFGGDFAVWERSIRVNALGQLHALHALHPLRRPGGAHAVFLAGAGTNGPAPGYSAYCASKILLIKMCELLDAEAPDLNVFIVGPGWVRTRIHEQTLARGADAGAALDRTRRFLDSGAPGTSMDDLYGLIRWGFAQGREAAGGRNFAAADDPWKNDGVSLARRLREDRDKFKLRRHRNRD